VPFVYSASASALTPQSRHIPHIRAPISQFHTFAYTSLFYCCSYFCPLLLEAFFGSCYNYWHLLSLSLSISTSGTGTLSQGATVLLSVRRHHRDWSARLISSYPVTTLILLLLLLTITSLSYSISDEGYWSLLHIITNKLHKISCATE